MYLKKILLELTVGSIYELREVIQVILRLRVIDRRLFKLSKEKISEKTKCKVEQLEEKWRAFEPTLKKFQKLVDEAKDARKEAEKKYKEALKRLVV